MRVSNMNADELEEIFSRVGISQIVEFVRV